MVMSLKINGQKKIMLKQKELKASYLKVLFRNSS